MRKTSWHLPFLSSQLSFISTVQILFTEGYSRNNSTILVGNFVLFTINLILEP